MFDDKIHHDAQLGATDQGKIFIRAVYCSSNTPFRAGLILQYATFIHLSTRRKKNGDGNPIQPLFRRRCDIPPPRHNQGWVGTSCPREGHLLPPFHPNHWMLMPSWPGPQGSPCRTPVAPRPRFLPDRAPIQETNQNKRAATTSMTVMKT